MSDIRITGANEELTKPSGHGILYNVHFTLSEQPDRIWIDAFDEARSFARHSMWREARVSGRHVVVHCPLDEAQRHLLDIKEDVETANAARRLALATQEQQRQREVAQRERERTTVRDTLRHLKFEDSE